MKKRSEETLWALQGLPGFGAHLESKVNLILATTCITIATEGNKGKKTEISQKEYNSDGRITLKKDK